MRSVKNPLKKLSEHPRVVEHPRSKLLQRLITIGLLSMGFLVALGVTLLVLLNIRDLKVDLAAKKQVERILQESVTKTNVINVESGMGFRVPYDANVFSGYGFVSNTAETRPGWSSGEDFRDNELKVKRNYTILRISPKEASSLGSWASDVYLSITTNFHKDYFAARHTTANANKSDLDIFLEAEKETIAKSSDGMKFASSKKMTINGREFYQIVLEEKTNFFDVVTVKHQYRYITVHDGSPYWMTIGTTTEKTEKDVTQYEAMIAAVTFSKHDSGALAWLSDGSGGVRVASASQPSASVRLAASVSDVTEGTFNDEGYVNTNDTVRLIAKNQLSTVRVGALRCADMHYRAENGATFDLPNACVAGTGSGSIISNDGYVLTNGHVVYTSNYTLAQYGFSSSADAELWTKFYTFITRAGYATIDEIKGYVDAYKKGDKTAAQKLFDIIQRVPESGVSTTNDKTEVNIQTSNTPMHLNTPTDGKRWSWASAAGNVTGTLIGFEVNRQASRLNLDNTETDVALVKINGTYPTVNVGSITRITTGDNITAIGFPAVVDDALDTKQTTTIPTVTQGEVTALGSDAGGHKLVRMSAVIAAGNSGGPAFDSDGTQVGINTYGGAACGADDDTNLCFGKGVARDAEDINILLTKYNVKLSSGGTLTNLWSEGIDKFLAGDYSGAASSFKQLDQKYPDNYLVKQFLSVAASQPASITMSTPSGVATNLVVVLLAVFGIIALVATVVVVILLSRHKPQRLVAAQPVVMQPQMPQYYPQQAFEPTAAQSTVPVSPVIAQTTPIASQPAYQPLPDVPQVVAPSAAPEAVQDTTIPPVTPAS